MRDVRVLNSDSAFYSWGMVFCTITDLEVASGDRGYDNGHRGIWLERGQDNLITNFNFTTRMYHDLSVSFYEHSTAFVNGTGKVRRAWISGHSAASALTLAQVSAHLMCNHTRAARLHERPSRACVPSAAKKNIPLALHVSQP